TRARRRSSLMRALRSGQSLALVLLVAITALPQATATIRGTITVNSKPARGIKVVALQGERYEKKPVVSAITDSEGHYQLQGVAIGDCTVTVAAPTFAGEEAETASKTVYVTAGESVTGIDLALTPGGV